MCSETVLAGTDIWAPTSENGNYAPSKDSDQPAHSRSLIRIFPVRILISQGCKASLCWQRRLWSDCKDAQADLSIRWASRQKVHYLSCCSYVEENRTNNVKNSPRTGSSCLRYILTVTLTIAGLRGSVGCMSDWWSGGSTPAGRQRSFVVIWSKNIIFGSFSPFHCVKKCSCQFLAKECAHYRLSAQRTKPAQ